MSDKVKRYRLWNGGTGYSVWLGNHVVSVPENSELVLATDYDTLKERADELAEAVEHEWHSGPVYDALTAYRGVSGE